MFNIWELTARAVVLLVTLPIHEYAHALTAVRLGDDTPAREGRLTLNPFRHLSLFGSMALLLVGFGWAKPVMVDPRNFRRPKRDMAVTSLAGPAANIVMALAAMAVYKTLYYTAGPEGPMGAVMAVVLLIVIINVRLAVFNLIPIPPLDGSKILGFFLPDKLYGLVQRAERYIMFALLALLWMNLLDRPIAFLSNGLLNALDFLTTPIDLIFG